ncbi:SDR family oxidoreductase [Kineosporia sp. J2-2]|uniref:SDR family oxidoreductase n=1 Tax=Kineosporia corallincola TaxID=2835133 RepID=A0ABS5TI19_9ACTN|nr:SDR family oxidoreductase [Kineosporia corallincola]MBT0770039.1 SDR family oxidoreductase [Kineosporia corallincola]
MRVLVTGAAGVVGREVVRQFTARTAPTREADVVATTRTGSVPGTVPWDLVAEPPPENLRGPWDVVVHLAASTRWTMTAREATTANIEPTRALTGLLGPGTHLVHVSTAYVGGARVAGDPLTTGFGGYRNGYEWSKAECENIVRSACPDALTVVRPPLVLGRRQDGAISRFSGPYGLLRAIVSGMAAVVVGSPEGFVEIAPVDLVAATVVDAALGSPPAGTRLEIVSAGERCLRLADLTRLTCETINEWRDARGIAPIAVPPCVPSDSWHRFFLSFAEKHLSPVQLEAVRLLGMFEGYTSLAAPFEPTRVVEDPAGVVRKSVRWWADQRPRSAGRDPAPWTARKPAVSR